MSKQSEAKQQQGYRTAANSCRGCQHYECETEKHGHWTYEKKLRCGIGGFKILKTASCNLYEKKQ